MSTKTTFKRVALVAAVAAAFAGVSTVAANATTPPTNVIATISAASPATSIVNGTPSSTVSTVAVNSTASAVSDGNHYVPITINAGSADAAYTVTTSGVGSIAGTPVSSIGTSANSMVLGSGSSYVWFNSATDSGTVTTGAASDNPGNAHLFATAQTLKFSVVSAVAGTQTITATPTNGTGAVVTETITWGAAPVVSAANSTVYITDTTTAVNTNPATAIGVTGLSADSTLVKDKTAGTERAAIIVTLKDNSSNAGVVVKSASVSASISGAGLVAGYAASGATAYTAAAKSATAVTDATSGIAAFAISGDGTSGLGTITVSYTNPTTGATTVLSTKTITFFSTQPAALKATQVLKVGNLIGTTLGGSSEYTGTSADTFGSTGSIPAFYVSVADSNGNATVPEAGIWSVTSSDTTVFASNSAASPIAEDANGNTGVGTYDFTLSPVNGATSGKCSTITVTYTPTNTLHAAVTTSAGTYCVGGTTVYGLTLTSDASSYTVGNKAVLTLTATDKAGNSVADGNYALFGASFAGLTSSSQITTTPFATTSGNTLLIGGVKTATIYAPYADGNVTITGALSSTAPVSAALAVAGSVSATIAVSTNAGAASAAATDAANEATDAANAATDAANAAADAADAATSAAQDASAQAQAALAAVNALSAKITVLAAQIAKIIKKLGA